VVATDDWRVDWMLEEMLEMAELRELSMLEALEGTDEVAEAGGDAVVAPGLEGWPLIGGLPPMPAQRAYGSPG